MSLDFCVHVLIEDAAVTHRIAVPSAHMLANPLAPGRLPRRDRALNAELKRLTDIHIMYQGVKYLESVHTL